MDIPPIRRSASARRDPDPEDGIRGEGQDGLASTTRQDAARGCERLRTVPHPGAARHAPRARSRACELQASRPRPGCVRVRGRRARDASAPDSAQRRRRRPDGADPMTVATAARKRRDRAPSRPHGIPAAFKQLEEVPAVTESRQRLLRALRSQSPCHDAAIRAIESDIRLTVATLRRANSVDSGYRRGVATIPRAFDVLTPAGVETLARKIKVIDFFELLPGWEISPETLRRHSVATQRVADHLAANESVQMRDELRVSALLHDVGKLLLGVAFPGYPHATHGDARTSEEQLRAERATLRLDHAAVGS